jgi:hypothetical protein
MLGAHHALDEPLFQKGVPSRSNCGRILLLFIGLGIAVLLGLAVFTSGGAGQQLSAQDQASTMLMQASGTHQSMQLARTLPLGKSLIRPEPGQGLWRKPGLQPSLGARPLQGRWLGPGPRQGPGLVHATQSEAALSTARLTKLENGYSSGNPMVAASLWEKTGAIVFAVRRPG